MAAVCWLASAWWLLRVDSSAPAPLWRPSGSALLRAVAPYGLYGLAFFAIVVVPQLVSGGLFEGRYSFNAPFAMTSGVAIVVLVPLLAQTVAATEHLLGTAVPRVAIAIHRGPDRRVPSHRPAVLARAADGPGWAGGGGRRQPSSSVRRVSVPPSRILGDLARHPGLLAACTVGYLCLGVGLFCSQLLFSLSAPMRPSAAAWAGLVALAVASIGGGVGGADGGRRRRAGGRGRRLRRCGRGARPPGLHAAPT